MEIPSPFVEVGDEATETVDDSTVEASPFHRTDPTTTMHNQVLSDSSFLFVSLFLLNHYYDVPYLRP